MIGTLTVTSSTISGNTAERSGGGGIYHNDGDFTVTDSVVNGNSAFNGGGIWCRDPNRRLTVINSTISDNRANTIAGISASKINIIDSLISGNAAVQSSGGLWCTEGNVTSSTISGNTAAGRGGGIYIYGGSLAITNSTISGNSVVGIGGGLFILHSGLVMPESVTTIVNSTFSGNSAFSGGGVANFNGHLVIRHSTITSNQSQIGAGVTSQGSAFVRIEVAGTIIAGNSGPDVHFFGVLSHAFQSHGYNLIGTGNATTNFNQPGDQTGVASPQLGPLAENGGPTMTHALLPGSPVIDAGDPSVAAGVNDVPRFDQRGEPFTRVHGGRIDIGAFEWQPNPLPGDYNFNGMVDTADIVVWRKSIGSTTDLRADGNGDGVVNQDDWQVWRANFGRTTDSGEQGAGSEEPAAVGTLPQRRDWQPPASPGVSVAASRSLFRPPTQRFEPEKDLLASLTSPRQMNSGRHELAPGRRGGWGNAPDSLSIAGAMPQAPARDTVADSADSSIHAIDHVFETLGANAAGAL